MENRNLVALAFLVLGFALVIKGLSAEAGKPRLKVPMQDHLTSDQGINKLFSLSRRDQDRLVGAVRHFCTSQYHRESCIHHLVTCGDPCLIFLSANQRMKIARDYSTLRAERGLAAIRVVRED